MSHFAEIAEADKSACSYYAEGMAGIVSRFVDDPIQFYDQLEKAENVSY